ncbi:MAG: hypothetical protein J5590_09120 [Clostridia bacterium]|nr:hypothetical protein [Clostridia bacterium]
MKEFRFDEILKREDGEYIMRLSADGKVFELLANGGSVEAREPYLWSTDDAARLLEALPHLDTPASFIINGAPQDLSEDAIISAAEKNWSIII